MVTITDRALKHVLDLMDEENIKPETHYLRVGVKGGGCSGLSYVMNFDDTTDQFDEVWDTEKGLKIIVDRKSYLYLFGTELDYTDGLNGKGFEWSNPNSSRTCGCGSSFAV